MRTPHMSTSRAHSSQTERICSHGKYIDSPEPFKYATTCRCYLIPHNSYDFLRINRVNGSIVTFLRSSGLYKQNPEQVVGVFFSLLLHSNNKPLQSGHTDTQFIELRMNELPNRWNKKCYLCSCHLCVSLSLTLAHSWRNMYMIDHNYDYADECWRIKPIQNMINNHSKSVLKTKCCLYEWCSDNNPTPRSQYIQILQQTWWNRLNHSVNLVCQVYDT